MRSFLALAVVVVLAPTHATAAPDAVEPTRLSGTTLTLEPGADLEPAGGGFGVWYAHGFDAFYVGGEIAIGTPTSGHADVANAYHLLAGTRSRLSSRISVLADAGLGVSQQWAFHLGLFGSESEFDTEAWAPSAAMRMQLVAELGTVSGSTLGVTLTGDARSTLDSDAALGMGVGLGFYAAR